MLASDNDSALIRDGFPENCPCRTCVHLYTYTGVYTQSKQFYRDYACRGGHFPRNDMFRIGRCWYYEYEVGTCDEEDATNLIGKYLRVK
jgi:hypothetical protein